MGLKSRAAIFFGSKAAEEQLSLVGLVVYVERDLVKGRDQVWYIRILPFEKVVFSKSLFQSVWKYLQRIVKVVISASVQH